MSKPNNILIFAVLICLVRLPAIAQSSVIDEKMDQSAMLRDIEGMLETKVNQMHLFKPAYATPARMARFMKTPEFMALRDGKKSNALALVGNGPEVLSFEKPSDVWTKISGWYPEEVKSWDTPVDGHPSLPFILYGPIPSWHPDAMAFVTLWNCAPKLAWWNHDRNPFAKASWGGPDLGTISAMESDRARYNFAFCISNDNGRKYEFPDTPEDRARILEFRADVARLVVPVLVDKLSNHLRRHRCSLTGPDDCVLSLRLWSEIAPEDPHLAFALQDLEAEVAPDAPLPPLLNPSIDLWSQQESDGMDRFNTARRNSAYLRAKLASMTMAPSYWRREHIQQTLEQMSTLSTVFNEPFVKRYKDYVPGYYSAALSPFDVFYEYQQALPVFEDAIAQELRRLGPKAPCSTLQPWFFHDSIHIRYVLDGLRSGNDDSLRCGIPSMEWLASQTEGPYKGLYYGLLAVLPYIKEVDRLLLRKAMAEVAATGAKHVSEQNKPNANGNALSRIK